MSDIESSPAQPRPDNPVAPVLPTGVLRLRVGPGANCSSAGSGVDVLFYGSAIVGALAVALAAAFPPKKHDPTPASDDGGQGQGKAD